MNISKLNYLLTKKVGTDWYDLELETISLELGAQFDSLTSLKIIVLKAIINNPDIIVNDAEYFMRFIEVANDNVPDPHHHDIPSSIELDFAIRELEDILGSSLRKTYMLDKLITYVVNHEGHGKAASKRLSDYSSLKFEDTKFTKVYDTYANSMRGGNA